ncbi:hypothetical protein ACFL1X_08120 [Candidatus Hydrogenedentota bacterium]
MAIECANVAGLVLIACILLISRAFFSTALCWATAMLVMLSPIPVYLAYKKRLGNDMKLEVVPMFGKLFRR